MLPITELTPYWENTWNERIKDNSSVFMNAEKCIYLIQQLWSKAYLAPMEKLDIGCGTGIHAVRLALYNPLWKSKWTGIDLSQKAIAFAQAHELNAFCVSIFDFQGNGKKYSLFLLLDSLEHFEDRSRLAKKIRELADEEYLIIGNVPLYTSGHSKGVERPITASDVKDFLAEAGCKGTLVLGQVYGIKGMPYLFFETSNTNRDFSRWCR